MSETVVDGLDHPECVTVGPDGLLYAGSESGAIYRIDPATGATETIAQTGGFVLGLAFDGAGALYICDNGRSEVLRMPVGGSPSPYSTGSPDRPMRTPNYAAFDADGTLYVTDSGSWGSSDGCIFRVARDGSTTVLTEAASGFPNGIALSPDGAHLYVVESLPPRITSVSIADGSAQLVVDLPGTVPDGIALDAEGTAYISCYRPDAILRLGTDGVLTTFDEDWQGTRLAAPTNIAFAGTDLYVANFARWHIERLSTPVPGLPLRYPN